MKDVQSSKQKRERQWKHERDIERKKSIVRHKCNRERRKSKKIIITEEIAVQTFRKDNYR